jgi:hypothetical protein
MIQEENRRDPKDTKKKLSGFHQKPHSKESLAGSTHGMGED